jgi:hypothetical protein
MRARLRMGPLDRLHLCGILEDGFSLCSSAGLDLNLSVDEILSLLAVLCEHARPTPELRKSERGYRWQQDIDAFLASLH